MRSDDVRMDGLFQHAQAVIEVAGPERLAELSERVAAPHVIDENVQPLVPTFDTGDELFHFRGHGVIHSYGDATPAGCRNQSSGLFDRFGPPGCVGPSSGAFS